MIDRRRFMTGGVAFAAALTAWPARGGATAPTSAGVAAPKAAIALVDRHVAGSAAFAAEARGRGWRVLEFASDVAALWMRELEPRLRAGPIVLAGHTSAATLFCVDLLARDYGACTVQRVDRGTSVAWTIASNPARRAALAPSPRRSVAHA